MVPKISRRQFALGGAALGFSVITARRAVSAPAEEHKLQFLPDATIGTIRPELHSHFAEHLGSCTYGGLWVGKNSRIPNINGHRRQAVEYLKALGIPVLRWPGGCFADDYHWRDGIGPVEKRPKIVNIHWGNYTEDNSFGTHEFIELCRLIGAEPYLAGNVGSGTPEELRDWVEYCNYPAGSTLSDERAANGSREPFKVRYWGVGNENWGCGGNMRGDEYSTAYRQFATYIRNYGQTPAEAPFLIACGPNRSDKEWTTRFFEGFSGRRRINIGGYAMHYYSNGSQFATKFTVEAMQQQFQSFPLVEQSILEQRELMNKWDPNRNIGLMVDEWGIWDRMDPAEQKKYGRLWQQITTRCGVGAALGLNVFHRQADKLYMCNIAQIVNVLHSLLLTEEDKCVRTPAYYAFELLKPHRGKTAIKFESDEKSPVGLSVSASRQDNDLVVSLVNPKHDATMSISASIAGKKAAGATARALYHADLNACNTFERPNEVVPKNHTASASGSGFTVELPPLSVVTVTAKLA
jgi:alpha-N-arabinofuranosidase